jgi:hypothetical protein
MPAYQGQRDFHRWDIEGKRVLISYLGYGEQTGTVVSSRVKYGGMVQHWVKLDETLSLPWDAVTEARTHVSVDDSAFESTNELLKILD